MKKRVILNAKVKLDLRMLPPGQYMRSPGLGPR